MVRLDFLKVVNILTYFKLFQALVFEEFSGAVFGAHKSKVYQKNNESSDFLIVTICQHRGTRLK